MHATKLPQLAPSTALAIGGTVVITAYVLLTQLSLQYHSYDVSAALLVAPLLVSFSLPIIRNVTRGDPFLLRLMTIGLVLKILSSIVRYYVAFQVYGGSADAAGYSTIGARIAESIRDGHLNTDVARGVPGTGSIDILTGLVYTLTGPSLLAGFLVFGWLAFWGQFLFYCAFRDAVPDGHHRHYALAVMLLPSMLYWPSSIGKDAWLVFALGVTALGVARIVTYGRRGYLLAGVGLLAIGLVRPHIAAFVVMAALAASVRRHPRHGATLRPVRTLVSMLLLALAMIVIVRFTTKFFGVDSYSLSEATDVLNETASRTGKGGSYFASAPVRSVMDLPLGFLTVLFRPLPHEAHNVQALFASIEGTMLLAFFAVRFRVIPKMVKSLLKSPWVIFVVVYVILFVIGFSYFENFGILTRQRVQVFPFVLTLLWVPMATRTRDRPGGSP